MAAEDYTAYTTGGGECSNVSVASDSISFTDWVCYDENCYVYKNFGASYFSDAFTHRFSFLVDEGTYDEWEDGFGFFAWGLANGSDDNIRDCTSTNRMFFFPYVLSNNHVAVTIAELENTNWRRTASLSGLSWDTRYYVEIEFDPDVGTNGTLYIRAYSDSNYSTLVDSDSFGLYNPMDYSVFYAFSGNDNAYTGYSGTGDVSDHDLGVSSITGEIGVQTLEITQYSVTPNPSDGFPYGWGRKAKITVHKEKVSGTHSKYRHRLKAENLPDELVTDLTTDGSEIRFANDLHGTEPLPWELVKFIPDAVAANADVDIWVLLENVTDQEDKEYYIFYDAPGKVLPGNTDLYGRNAVWEDDYICVHHLVEDTNDYTDSTGKGHDGYEWGWDASKLPNPTTIGEFTGQEFERSGGDEFVQCPGVGDNNALADVYTVQVLVKPSLSDSDWASGYKYEDYAYIGGSNGEYHLRRSHGVGFQFVHGDGFFFRAASASVDANAGQVYLLHGGRKASGLFLMVDGVLIDTYYDPVDYVWQVDISTNLAALIGGGYMTPIYYAADAVISEHRVANFGVSADLAATETENFTNPGTFATCGAPVDNVGSNEIGLQTLEIEQHPVSVTTTSGNNEISLQSLSLAQYAVSVSVSHGSSGGEVSSESYGFKVYLELSPIVDYSSKVKRFEITDEIDSFCREITLEIADKGLYALLDFTTLPENPQITVYTQTSGTLYPQGSFFIEKAANKITANETVCSLWGRSKTALLGEPFAERVSKEWTYSTSLFEIVQEMCELVGLTFNSSNSEVSDFTIYENTFSVENEYPIDVINEILELGYGPDARLCTDGEDKVIIRKISRNPSSSDHSLTDLHILEIGMEPEYPEYGNRIKISPAEKYAIYFVNLYVDNNCLNTGGTERTAVWARVTDGAENPVNGVEVDWLIMPAVGSLLYEVQKSVSREIVVSNEVTRADSFNTVEVKFPPDSVIGIWAYADFKHETNLIDGGYDIDENFIYLHEALEYCDQLVLVSYVASGIAENTIYIPGSV